MQRPGYPLPKSWAERSNVDVLRSSVKNGDRVTTNLSSSEVRWRINNADESNKKERELENDADVDGGGDDHRRVNEQNIKFGNSIQGLCDLSVINFMERQRLYTSNTRDIELEMKIL